MKKFILIVLVGIVAMFSLSACYVNKDVSTNQIGVKLSRNAIVQIAPPGVYSGWGFYDELRVIDVDTMTFSIEDPEVITADNQAVGLKITVQARRKSDEDSIRNLVTNWNALTSNEAFINTISATAREGMKNGSRAYTLAQLLDDRNGLSQAIASQLELDATKYSAEIINVTIENIAIDTDYMAMLKEKALLRAQTEKELQRQELIKQQASNDVLQAQNTTKVLEEQLIQAQAQTALDLEIATREGKKIAAANAVYETNIYAFTLEKLRLMKDIVGKNWVFYVPQGMDMMQILNQTTGATEVIPVTPK